MLGAPTYRVARPGEAAVAAPGRPAGRPAAGEGKGGKASEGSGGGGGGKGRGGKGAAGKGGRKAGQRGAAEERVEEGPKEAPELGCYLLEEAGLERLLQGARREVRGGRERLQRGRGGRGGGRPCGSSAVLCWGWLPQRARGATGACTSPSPSCVRPSSRNAGARVLACQRH